ncbi:UNVERIFIED_CONTAM: hypothetical protein K2H54_030225 [Gekko kuhli]
MSGTDDNNLPFLILKVSDKHRASLHLQKDIDCMRKAEKTFEDFGSAKTPDLHGTIHLHILHFETDEKTMMPDVINAGYYNKHHTFTLKNLTTQGLLMNGAVKLHEKCTI